MEKKNTKAKLTAQISLALMAGMFSMVPVVYGAPVVDKTRTNTANVSSAGFVTDVKGTQQNNVVHWQDFSVAKGETVQFVADNSNDPNNPVLDTTRNYLNLVTGENVSRIDGTIQGGNDIYIINQNGVIFGKSASVDVGSLYVSTTSAIDSAKIDAFTTSGTNPLTDTAASAAADIVNMGKVTADSVYVEGGNIKFMNTEDITASQVTANAQGTVRFDHKSGVDTSNFVVNTGTRDDYTLITTKDELQNINTNATTLSGHYALGNDITSVGTFVPIGTSGQPFTGAFDGNYYKVSGININANAITGYDYAGLFGYVAGTDTQKVEISNLGLTDVQVKGLKAAGGLAGHIEYTDIENVFVSGTSKLGHYGANFESVGGLIGEVGTGGDINSVYVTGAELYPKDNANYKIGGLVGKTTGTVNVNNSYTTNITFDETSSFGGIVGYASDATNISNVYTTSSKIVNSGGSQSNTYIVEDNQINGGTHNTVGTDAKAAASYAFLGDSTSNDTWRIYEGESLPLLRSFLRANGTASVNYTYTRDGENTTHNSADDTVWTYNGKTTTINATSSVNGTVSKDIRNKGTYNLFTSNQEGYDYVGNAIIVKPYQIKTGIKQDTEIKKVYDGTADATSALTNLFQGTSGGIFEEDVNSTTNPITMTFEATNEPKFTKDGSESPNAGVGKTVTVTGTVKLTGDTYGNYELVDINNENNVGVVTDNVNSISFTGTSNNGVIEQRELRIELATPTGINREYNGKETVYDEAQTATANYTPEKQIQLAATQGTNGGLANGETLDNLGLSYDTNAYYVDWDADNATYSRTKNAGSHAVEYGKIKLNSANYKLVDATDTSKVIYSAAVTGLDGTGVNTTNGGALYGSGTINKKSLSSKDFSWYKDGIAQTATKEYDGSTGYTAPVGNVVKNVALAALPASEDLTFTVQSADFVTSSEGALDANNHRTAATTKNAGTAQGVLYTVSITGDDAVNYTLDGAVINTTGTNTVIGAGTITPRTLNLIVNANADMDKVYDGNAYVTGATENNPAYLTDAVLSGATGFLKYQDTDADHHFLSNDTNAQIKVIGKYQATGNDYGEAKNVNYDAANNTALAKDIVYEAAVMEGNAESSNYKFAIINTGNTVVEATNTDATKADFKGTDAQGIINQREIDKIVFADVEKTYDGSSAVTNTTNNGNDVTFKTNDRITIKDLQLNGASALSAAGETVGDVLDVDANGQIAEGTSGALISGVYGEGEGTAWQANEHAGDKVVHYTISDGLWKNHNYKLTADAKFEGNGTINKLAIAPDDIKLERNNTVITKVYNGDTDVATVADNVGNVNRSVTDYLTERQAYVSKDGHELDIAVQVDGANYETSHHKNVSGSTDLTVNYTVSLVNAADYTIKDTDGHSVTQITRDEDANGDKITGTISARPITVTTADIVHNDAASGGLTKVYDATANVNGSGESLVSGINSQILSADQTDGVANATTGAYNNKHVNSNDTANLDANGLKTVTYALQLANDNYGDYKFVDANGGDITQIEGKGTITKRSLTLTTTAHPVKTYTDGSAAVETSDMPTRADINFGSTENNDVVASDGFTASALTGAYQITGTEENAGDVNRAADRTVLDKNIIYSGVLAALGTTNAGNYDVADTFTGTGRIDPNTINYLDFQFVLQDNIRQTYSGNDTVGEYGMEGDALTNFQKGWIDKDNSGIKIGNDLFKLADGAYGISRIESARFNDANAGTGKTVTYRIHVDPDTLQNYDYIETYTDNTGTHTVAKDSIYLDAVNNTGIIDKRAVVASVTHDTLEKYYDGTEKIYNGDNAAYSGAASGTELSGADAVTFADVVADGTTTQTGLLDGTNVSTGAYDGTGVGTNNKTINYTAKVDAAHSGNYKFVDAAGNELTNGQGTALTTTQNTINPFGVVLTTGDTTKTYDGTKGVTAAKSTAALQLGNNYDNLQLTNVTDNTGVYDNPNVQNGAAHTVTYTGFALNNDNYYLAKADGSAMDTDSAGNNVITGKGYITKYTLTALPTFTIHDVTKEYDTDALVKYNRSSDADAIKRNFITATNLPGDIAYELVKAEYTDSARGVGKTVNFTLQLSSDNYNFDSLVNAGLMNADGTFAESGTGDITPRKVYVSLDTTPEIKKTYDGDAGVEQDVTNMIIVRDGDLLNDGTRLNRNASVINAQYEDKDAGDNKKVIYQVQLTGNGADNYEIHRLENLGTNADSVYNTLEGTGKIDKATLTFNPDDHAFDRDYRKDDANVGLNAGSVVLTGVNGETVTLNDGALNKVTAEFGKGTGANDFTADENVSWNGDNVVDKDIRFTGLDNALQYMVDNNVDTISKNYTIDGTAYFAAAKAKGKIKPITITQAATENWKAVTREYNADTDLQEVYDYSGATAEPLGINDILTFTLTHDGNTVTDSNGNALTVTYTAAGQYDNQNVGDNHTLNYHINSVETKVKDAAGNANYILDDSVLTALVNHDVDSGAANNAGNAAVYSHITPRQLNAAVVKDSGNRKIYDGNDRADTSNFVVDADDQAILSKDGLLNDVVITARYGDKHASVNPGEADSNSKTITYTLALNDNSGNYAIATPSAAAQGDIERRKVYVDGTNAVAAPKDYDGNTDLPSGTDYNAMGFGLRDADSTTGLVSGDSDLKLDATQVEGHYVSPDVKRAADGSVIAQNINFTGFTLNDTDTGNDNSINDYVVIDADGSGVIKPLPVTVGIVAAPTKTYDGTTAIAAANNNVVVTGGLLTGDSANILIHSGSYDDANAGTNKGYTYNITLDNGNYTLAQGTDAPTIEVSGNGLKGKVTASDGTIDKRTITPTVNGIMTKVYDGTTAGTENAAANISLGNVVSGDNVGLTAKAVYDSSQAGKSEDGDELQNHRVTYTLNLSNPNYQLAEDTVTGTGTITRKGLTIVASPAAIRSGEAMPVFSGTVEGLAAGDERLASGFTFDTLPTVTNTSIGNNPVFGWYRNQTEGNFGLNYTFSQDAGNTTAFTVEANNFMDNPDTRITPNNNIYHQISHDMSSGFGDTGAAAIEYQDKGGNVIATETIDSGEIHDSGIAGGREITGIDTESTTLANIGIVGGDIVNLEGADAASMANIEVDGDGSIVNLQVFDLTGADRSGSDNSTVQIAGNDSTNLTADEDSQTGIAEITNMDTAGTSSIQIVDESGNVLEEREDKAEKQEKEGEIAIESPGSQNDDEIELTVEGEGVNVA